MKIVAVSDLHGNLPVIPACDLLLIAGDLCPDFVAKAPQRAWFVDKFVPWVKAQPAKAVYATWGNHDWLPRPSAQWADLNAAQGLIKIDELVFHPMPADPDPEVLGGGVLKMWFSPWSNQFGHWAWMDHPGALADRYVYIPEGVNILVSHQPPYGYGDVPDPRYYIGDLGDRHVGSRELLSVINRVQPEIVICGHIHGGYGTYKHGRTRIYNASLVDEAYRPINPLTVIEW